MWKNDVEIFSNVGCNSVVIWLKSEIIILYKYILSDKTIGYD